MILLVSIVTSKLSLSETEKITTLDNEKLNLTKAEKGKIDSNYENFKLGKVIDYQKGTYHTYINFDSGYRVITINKNFEKVT
ncbi:hypothetical protein LCGC14_0642680 [marine sediment metagenome]|uniref:Uncharacterized protein n=1 Tax=marine sediment metagenome TaxID=412755 RepID=A0A0F9TK85_9ZZZZ